MTNKTATQVMLETQQKEIEARVLKEKLLQLMKVRLDKATRAYYFHLGAHGKFLGLNEQLSKERVELREEMLRLQKLVSSIGRDKVLRSEMKMSFVTRDGENIILNLVDAEILDFLKL